MYTSNTLHQDIPKLNSFNCNQLILLVGNSADPSNNHIDMFDKILATGAVEQIKKIYCPLSYGDHKYGERVERYGHEVFGNMFIPLKDFMPLDEYNAILESVNVAIFNHDRQQAMGNTINLLGMGKKVFIKSGTSTWDLLNRLGITVFDVEDLEFSTLDAHSATQNWQNVKNYFNEDNLLAQLNNVFQK